MIRMLWFCRKGWAMLSKNRSAANTDRSRFISCIHLPFVVRRVQNNNMKGFEELCLKVL